MRRRLPVAVLLVLVIGCTGERELVPDTYQPSDARDVYRRGLQEAGLAGAALGLDWQRAGDAAIAAPMRVDLPYRERGYFDAREAHAVGYRFPVRRGQRVEVGLRIDAAEPTVFIDLFRLDAEGKVVTQVASADPASRLLVFEPRADADYLLRVQPELLRGGSYELSVGVEEALAFPVSGFGMSAAQSGFGAPRDGGNRSHHGVDIFAPRGTPVVAVSRALVRRVREQNLGGKVVWLHDPQRRLHLYYAHLDEQLVEPGTWVMPGDVIGRVGNTGNARTTPPHLHFGIYAEGEGPQNPDPYLRPPRQRATGINADTALVGSFAEIGEVEAAVRSAPASRADVLMELPGGTLVRVWAAVGDFYRVGLTGGASGFIRAGEVRALTRAAVTDD